MARRDDLRSMVRNQIIDAIRRDLDGGESLMKEVYERCDTDGEAEIVRDEMRRVIEVIRRQGRMDANGVNGVQTSMKLVFPGTSGYNL